VPSLKSLAHPLGRVLAMFTVGCIPPDESPLVCR